MKSLFSPLLVSTHTNRGGAAIATARLFAGLKKIEANPAFLSFTGKEAALFHQTSNLFERLWGKLIVSAVRARNLRAAHKRPSLFNDNLLYHPIHQIINRLAPDIVHLHWIGTNFLPIQSFPLINAPLLWTLHDMWAFTGGCHYDNNCGRYRQSCGACPILFSTKANDKSNTVFRAKHHYWNNLDLTIVTPSNWLKNLAKESPILEKHKIVVIPNGIDTEIYKPLDRNFSREVLGIPSDLKLILLGADTITNPEKGQDLLIESLERLYQNRADNQNIGLGILGAGSYKPLEQIGFPTYSFGHIGDERILRLIYTSSDLFVIPSKQDNLPNMVLEALACGIPCVGFKTGGIPEMVDHLENGYLAEPFDTIELQRGITWVLEHNMTKALNLAARAKIENQFELEQISREYFNLYQDILINSRQF